VQKGSTKFDQSESHQKDQGWSKLGLDNSEKDRQTVPEVNYERLNCQIHETSNEKSQD
jgi:hypothetical protein